MTRRSPGFSLVEMLVTLMVLAMVVAALMIVMVSSQRSKSATEAQVEAQQSARSALDLIAGDIRSAGYGVDADASPPQPAFAYVDSEEILLYANEQPESTLRSSEVPDPRKPPLAPSPAGAPLPVELQSGSIYPAGYRLPTAKWRTGAELIRYTLDLNDDGVINATDQANALAGEAQRSLNPNDFVLARVVYGDSCGWVPNNNGGSMDRVALVRKPGGDVPPMFTVYFGSNPTPWNWANGPVPANRLDEISRVTVTITTEARRPDKNGVYSRASLTTEVNSLRNVPTAGTTSYQADGFVFNDLNGDGVKNAGEPGIPNVVMRMGTAGVGETNSLGYYLLSVPPAQYTLKQEVPVDYGAYMTPDSLVVNFINYPADVHHDFSDSARTGGWILDTCWVDADGNGLRGSSELRMDGVSVAVNGVTHETDGAGAAQFFVYPGTYSVSAVAPDSFTVSTANPVTVTVANHDTVRTGFGLIQAYTGTVTGKIFRDLNRNGAYDAGEPGLTGVWVAVTKNNCVDVMGFANTNAAGDFSITAPANDPDHVTPYQVTYQVPNQYFPVGSTVHQPIWLGPGQTITGQNFGCDMFTRITLTADRVLSLGSGELMEKDWSGSDSQYDSKGHKDKDLILGSEYVSNPNVSVWFNQWNAATLFTPSPSYQRNAQSSALSMAVGCLDNGSPATRPDVVTGLHTYASGNLAVWITQNSSGNFGYLPTPNPVYYKTQDNGDVNAVLLALCDANSSLDIIAGTKSASGSGTIEVWLNNSGTGAFTRDEIYPPSGGMVAGGLGEVRGMALGDFDADGDSDLVVVTKTTDLHGKLHVFEKAGSVAGARYVLRFTHDLSGEGNAVAVADVDGDGRRDFIVGTKTNSNAGRLEYWRNNGLFGFSEAREVNAPGIVLSLAVGDLGGATRQDLAVGFRDNDTAYTGGVRVFFLDSGTLPNSGIDPSAGDAEFMTPAITLNNFNYGDNPLATGPQLLDLAVAQKPTATTGQVVIFFR